MSASLKMRSAGDRCLYPTAFEEFWPTLFHLVELLSFSRDMRSNRNGFSVLS